MNTHLYFFLPYVSCYASQLPFVVLVNGTQYIYEKMCQFPFEFNNNSKVKQTRKVHIARESLFSSYVCLFAYKLYDEKVSCKAIASKVTGKLFSFHYIPSTFIIQPLLQDQQLCKPWYIYTRTRHTSCNKISFALLLSFKQSYMFYICSSYFFGFVDRIRKNMFL